MDESRNGAVFDVAKESAFGHVIERDHRALGIKCAIPLLRHGRQEFGENFLLHVQGACGDSKGDARLL